MSWKGQSDRDRAGRGAGGRGQRVAGRNQTTSPAVSQPISDWLDRMADALSDLERDSLISQFSDITGSESDQSKAYLEANGWDLDLAIASFFEEAEEQGEQEADRRSRFPDQPQLFAPGLVPAPPAPTPPAAMSDSKKKSAPRTGIATLSSLRRENESAGSDSDDDNNQQAFYAGGSDRSGQQILGPKDKKKNPEQLVKEMFQSAREHGGQVVDESGTTAGPSRLFAGTGFRLGDDVGQESPPVQNSEPPSVAMVLKMWRNGFSVDDGPLRPYRDPENADFLSSIRRGQIPDELLTAARGGEVNLNMEDHQTEEFAEVKKSVRAFGGEGHRLGNVAPVIAPAAPVGDTKQNEAAAQAELNVDDAKPVTSIQIRLSDGTRLVIRINTDQSIARIREYICRARPEMGAILFRLMTTFPNKELDNEEQTVAEANLQNASIVVRLV